MPAAPDNGIQSLPSAHSFDDIVARLEVILQTKGINLFAIVDHSAEAEKAGLPADLR